MQSETNSLTAAAAAAALFIISCCIAINPAPLFMFCCFSDARRAIIVCASYLIF
jgi:hypothetical protein